MLCYDIDDETLHLVLQLHMEDLEEIRKSSKGKHRQDELPDADFAIEMYRSEIESRALFASDRSMCRSIAQAARRDGELVNTLVQEEQQALEDRQYALWLSRQDDTSEDEDSVPTRAASFRAPAPEPTAGAQYNPAANDRFLQRLHVMYMDANAEGEEEDDTLAEPESSSWGASRADSSNLLAAHQGRRKCNGCFEEFARSKIARCPCDHGYCRGCLSRIFENSITDESLFPPRCCAMHIPVDGSRAFLSPALVGRFRARKLELSTRDKTYCFIPTCSQFIPKQFIKANIATCQRCSQRTCTICKAAEHKNEDCPQDAGTQTVLRVAKENEWQQCRTCHRIVELTTGCNHMVCRCGAQFCYICGAKWKTCRCPQADENRVIARTNAIVERDAQPAAANAATQDARNQIATIQTVQNLMRAVSNAHECGHDVWRTRKGSFRCEECLEVMPHFIYECDQCHVQACRQCRYHRFRQEAYADSDSDSDDSD